MTLFSRLRVELLLGTVALYLILNAGFMQVRIPPGGEGSIPVAELVLILLLATTAHLRILPRFARAVFLLPFALWLALGLSRAAMGFLEHGFWALRDAVHVIESLFLYVGFAFALEPRNTERFFRWLKVVLLIGAIYGLGMPLRETLEQFSPSLTAAAGYERPIFFQYQAFYCVVLWATAYLLIFRPKGTGLLAFVVAGFLVAYLLIFYQSKTLYLQIFALVILFAVFRHKAFGKTALILVGGFAALAMLPVLELEIGSRFGEAVSLDLFYRHFLSGFGISDRGVESSAGGVYLRWAWWSNLFREVTQNAGRMLFGLGYGLPLLDFEEWGLEIREPHNSYVSIFSRIGFLGLAAFLWLHVVLMRRWVDAYKACKRMDWQVGRHRLLLLLSFFVILWIIAFTEDAFEKPFFTVPYYFFWGVVLAFAENLRHGVYVPRPAAKPAVPLLPAPGPVIGGDAIRPSGRALRSDR